jgi:hypothetical protein
MNVIKKIGFGIAYALLSIVKLPFTLLVALSLWIETIFMKALVTVTKWYGNDEWIEAANTGLALNAGAAEYLEETYLDMKIES